jgi:hypothetical protein
MGAISPPGRHQYELWTRRDGRTLVVPAQRKLVASTGFTWRSAWYLSLGGFSRKNEAALFLLKVGVFVLLVVFFW